MKSDAHSSLYGVTNTMHLQDLKDTYNGTWITKRHLTWHWHCTLRIHYFYINVLKFLHCSIVLFQISKLISVSFTTVSVVIPTDYFWSHSTRRSLCICLFYSFIYEPLYITVYTQSISDCFFFILLFKNTELILLLAVSESGRFFSKLKGYRDF